jgi:hypothetical protein
MEEGAGARQPDRLLGVDSKKWGRLPPPPKDNLEQSRQAGVREGHPSHRLQSLALNSNWILRGSLTDAV